ncbi:MAG TPA: MinD/ParA family protein [Steroidobacteraceae bacterium]|nr:MinD/ParA family protein [Steroidobacteraceae bacterium]
MPQPELRAHALSPPPVQVIAVTGGKGGTGKTSVAINLATALAQAGRRTMLLDGDLGLANVDVLLGLTPRCTLEHVVRGERSLEEVIVETAAGVRVVPAASGVARMAALSSSEQAGIIRAFGTLPEPLEVLIVDTAAGISAAVLQLCQSAQQVLVVLRDEPASLTDTYAMIKVLSRQHGLRQFRVLANMTRTPGQGDSVFRRLQRVTDRYLEVMLEFVGEIPDDGALQKAVQAQRSVLELFPSSPSALAFKQLARVAARWPLPSGPSGRLEFFFERMLARPAPQLKVLK